MVFFREVPFFLTTRSCHAVKRGDYYQLKVKISGEVSKLSGMIINLKEVDLALVQVQKNVTDAPNVAQALRAISRFLTGQLDVKIEEIEISRGSNSMALTSFGLLKKWRTSILIGNQKVVTSKKCQFFYTGKKPSLSAIPYLNTEQLIKSLKDSPSQITEVRIRNEKVQGFEIFQL